MTPDEYLARSRAQQGATVKQNAFVLSADPVKPDVYAQDKKLGEALGLGASLAGQYRDTFAQRMMQKRNETILKANPRLNEWVQAGDNGKLASDDLEPLSWWEQFAKGKLSGPVIEAGKGVPGGAVSAIGTALEGGGQITSVDQKARLPIVSRIASAPQKSPEEIALLRQEIFKQGAVNPAMAQSVLSDVLSGDMSPAEAYDALEPLLTEISPQLQRVGEAIQEYGGQILPAEPGQEESMARQVGAGLGSMLSLMGIGLLTGGGGLVTSSAAMGMGEASANARKAGQDEDTQTIAAAYGSLAGLTDIIPIERILANPAVKSGVAGFFRSMGKQAALEGGQEAAQQFMQNAISQMLYAPDKSVLEDLKESFAVGGITGALVDAARQAFNAAIPGRVGRMQVQAATSEADRAKIEEIGNAASVSKLRERHDGTFMDFVGAATEGTPVEQVYVPAAKMQELFQGANVDPRQFMDELPGVDVSDWDMAIATGGDVKIPTSVYAAKLAGTDFDAFLRDNMRFSPDGMTWTEAQEFNARVEEIRLEAFEEAEQRRLADEEERAIDVQEYDELVGRLRAAGRSTDVARFEAMPITAMRRTMAARSGLTPEEFAAKFPLPELRGVRPEGIQSKDVDALSRNLAELRAYVTKPAKRGSSLLEAISDYGGINDVGGELKARDAAVIKRGKGKKTLRLARKQSGQTETLFKDDGSVKSHSIDDVARAMIDAGYMQDSPVVAAYQNSLRDGTEAPDISAALLAAIDEELRGNVQYSTSQDAGADPREAEYENTVRYLNQVGVALEDDDAIIRQALEQADKADYRQTYGEGARGSILFGDNGRAIINLFEQADLSTVIHETGHYFLNNLRDLAAMDADGEVGTMFTAVKGWWRDNAADVARDGSKVSGTTVTADDVRVAVDSGTTGDAAKDAAIDIGMHEQFARGLEAYMMEGKAPSIELRSAFERFTQWLTRIYRQLKGLNVKVSGDLRSVLDRMLATDEEIDAARADLSDDMLFAAADAAGVSREDYQRLVKLHGEARDAAVQKLRKEAMAPIQRETEKWFKDEKKKVRAEVEQQINRTPVYRVWEWLGNRRWLDDDAPEDMPDLRMDREALVSVYGEGVLKTLPRGKFALYSDEGGVDPDEVAGWFGFTSGNALVTALEKAPPRKDAIDAETDRVMRERHGDVLHDGQIEERAIEVVHSDKRAQFIAAELKIIAGKAGLVGMSWQQAREAARQTLNRMQVRDAVSSNRFLVAERKAANEAVRFAKSQKWNKLFDAKRRQLLNHMLYDESRRISDEVEKAERFVGRLNRKGTRDALAGDYLEAIDELLERYDFRKISRTAEERRGALLGYIDRMKAEGRENELSIPDAVIQNAKRRPYKRLSVDELRGVMDALHNIEHSARLKQTLKDAKRERELAAVVSDVLAEFDENVKGKAPSRAKSGRGNEFLSGHFNLVKNADTVLRTVDGFKEGATYRHIKGPIDDAVNNLTVMRRQAGEDFDKLYSVYSSAERRAMATLLEVPELNGQFSKWDLISIALNTGNEGNYQRLTDDRVQGHFTPEQVETALARLDERDWKFVQSAWDLIDAYWPQIEAREKRTTGVAPEKIAAREVATKFGTFRGGYYPLKYDAELSGLVRDETMQDIAQAMTGGRFGKAQTRNGHLKERAQSSGRPVMIDIGVLHGHVNQVVHDLALSEAVSNSWRILQSPDVKGAFLQRGMKAEFDNLETWLLDVASGEIRSADFMSRWARKLKSGFTVSKLAFNLKTVLLQPTGLAQAAVVVGKKNLLRGMLSMFRRGAFGIADVGQEVTAKSPFMAERQTTFNKDIYDILGETKAGPTQGRVGQFMSNVIAPWGFLLMQKAQFYTVDLPIWLASYRQATDDGMSDADATAFADRNVARAAASGNFSDRTPIERGTLSGNVRQNDVVRMFTALGSYMFAKFNVAYERTGRTNFRSPTEALSWAFDITLLFTVEAVLAAFVNGELGGDDEDDEGWAEFLAKQTALSVAGTLPFVRDISSSVQGYSGGSAYGSIMDTIGRPLAQASQGEIDKGLMRSIVDAGGLFLHLPSTQIWRSADAAFRASEGEDVSPMEFVVGKAR